MELEIWLILIIIVYICVKESKAGKSKFSFHKLCTHAEDVVTDDEINLIMHVIDLEAFSL